jgi:hypothetical protein
MPIIDVLAMLWCRFSSYIDNSPFRWTKYLLDFEFVHRRHTRSSYQHQTKRLVPSILLRHIRTDDGPLTSESFASRVGVVVGVVGVVVGIVGARAHRAVVGIERTRRQRLLVVVTRRRRPSSVVKDDDSNFKVESYNGSTLRN